MKWIIVVTLFWPAFKAALCLNIEPVAWKFFRNHAAGFGYQVVQRETDLLTSAPLEQYLPNERGEIFWCSSTTEKCQPLLLPEDKTAVNMSIGLAMTSDPTTQNILLCGPSVPKDCKSITMYNGVCIEIAPQNSYGRTYPNSTEECRDQADIALLLDGSGSVSAQDFIKMKTFVKNLIGSFQGKDTRFSITQFSYETEIHFDFNSFPIKNWEQEIDNINQIPGGTHTAKAIKTVVNNVFSKFSGSRENVKKILLVITDGKSTDSTDLPAALKLAEEKSITRFSVGVGSVFARYDASVELEQIASNPDLMLKVQNFEDLERIQENLQERIFSIEGSQTAGETLKQEMSQEGFRVAYSPEGIQMTAVGLNQWRGGYKIYSHQDGKHMGSFEPMDIEPDSYLGYSIAVATTYRGTLTVVGAPRFEHKGAVITVYKGKQTKLIKLTKQSGAYFGAEVCAMDVNSDSYTDLILISAPMYKDQGREGRVYVCTLYGLIVECHFDSPSQLTVLRGDPSDNGRFGSSLAVLPDLNGDGLKDLAVGAPLENNNQGSIYIFYGEGSSDKTISSFYSQRIAAFQVKPGLKFFGLSISQWSYDQSGDSLPDLAVGSKGAVVLLRSRPAVMVDTTVSFNPKEIPNVDCAKPLDGTATICFNMRGLSGRDEVRAQINYTLTLDATRLTPNNRAYISKDTRDRTGSVVVDLNGQKCSDVKFFIKACPEDALNPLENELSFTFDGLPSNTNLRPSLSQEAQTTTLHPIKFEISCGADKLCTDNLKVDFNFTRSSVVKVGIDELLNVTVSVENRGENSYNNHVILTYPVGLSYRKLTSLHGRIKCSSLDSKEDITRGKTDCTVDKPIFKTNSVAAFIVSYGFNPNKQLDKWISVTANTISDNKQHSKFSELHQKKEIEVKYSISVVIESPRSYNNFTFGKNYLQKPFQQLIKVGNMFRMLNFTVVIKVPIRLGDKDIWVDKSSLQITDCEREKDEPAVTDFVAQVQENKVVNCSVASCSVFRCRMSMERLEEKSYKISANLSSGWIEQIGLPSVKFILTSTASLEYDRNQYIYFSTTSNNNSPVFKIESEIEVFPEPNFTKEIIGGILGGLFFLILLTAALYKAGFFKSKYNQMVGENATGEVDPMNG